MIIENVTDTISMVKKYTYWFFDFISDLENLLGKPYQQSLAAETGIDIALDALEELRLCK